MFKKVSVRTVVFQSFSNRYHWVVICQCKMFNKLLYMSKVIRHARRS